MPQEITDFLKRATLGQEVGGACVTKSVGSPMRQENTKLPRVLADRFIESTLGYGLEWSFRGQKHLATLAARSGRPQVSKDRVAYDGHQGICLSSSQFGTADQYLVTFPVDVFKLQLRDLANPQPIDGQEHHGRTIPDVARPLRIQAGNETLDVLPGRTRGNVFPAEEPWSSDGIGYRQVTPASHSSESKKGLQCAGIIDHAHPAPSGSSMLSEVAIDIRDLDVGDRTPFPLVPTEKLPDAPISPPDGYRREASLALHPCGEIVELAQGRRRQGDGVPKATNKAKPLNRQVAEFVRRVWAAAAVLPTMPTGNRSVIALTWSGVSF